MNFFGFGVMEIAVVGVLALIFIGPEKLPGVIRQVMQAYRQVRSLGTEWRDQVEREIGSDLRSLTGDINQGLEAFGRSVESEIQAVDAEIRDAQTQTLNPASSSTTDAAAPPSNPDLPSLSAPARAVEDDEDERPRSLDYRPG